MKALILAAGYATRLYPLTKEYPKPLLKVEDRPIINYILDKLEQVKEITEVIVVTNSKFISHFRKWSREIKSNKCITLVDDLTKTHSDRRGAVGDIDFAIDKKHIKDNLLVIGGDNLFTGGLVKFVSFAQKNKPYPIIGVYNINKLSDAAKYGVVKLDAKNRIRDFQEKPKNPKSTLVAMCLYYFSKEKLGLIKEYLNIKESDRHDATGFYIDWLKDNAPVYGFVFNGSWYDIGDHHFYNEAKKNWG